MAEYWETLVATSFLRLLSIDQQAPNAFGSGRINPSLTLEEQLLASN